MGQYLYFFPVAEFPFYNINDFPQVDGAQKFGGFGLACLLKQLKDFFVSFFPLKKDEQGLAVEKIRTLGHY
jgi:hypothetical protein